MLAKNLVREIVKRGGEAEITERDLPRAMCTTCHEVVRRSKVLNMTGPDYVAWFSEPGDSTTCPSGQPHTPRVEYEVNGTLNGYDVHMYGESSGYFTVRAISKRGYYDPCSDYNSGGYTFCNRLKDLDWAIPTAEQWAAHIAANNNSLELIAS